MIKSPWRKVGPPYGQSGYSSILSSQEEEFPSGKLKTSGALDRARNKKDPSPSNRTAEIKKIVIVLKLKATLKSLRYFLAT